MKKILILKKDEQQNILEYMPRENTIFKLAGFFSLFSDPTRIKILTALCLSKMCVNDLSTILNINQTTISHQLKHLRQNGAVVSSRQGKLIYYSIANNYINEVMLNGVDYLLAN